MCSTKFAIRLYVYHPVWQNAKSAQGSGVGIGEPSKFSKQKFNFMVLLQEAKKTKTHIFWNVWVLLAMPLVWLSWSILLFLLCIMCFVWRTSPSSSTDLPQPPTSDRALLGIRILLTLILALGINYAILIYLTFRRYGVVMDGAWKKRVNGWLNYSPVLSNAPPCSYNSPCYLPLGAFDRYPDNQQHGSTHSFENPMFSPYPPQSLGSKPYSYATDAGWGSYNLGTSTSSCESEYLPSDSDNSSDYRTRINTLHNTYTPPNDTVASQETDVEASGTNSETFSQLPGKSRTKRRKKRTSVTIPLSPSLPTISTTSRPTITHSQTEPYVGLEDDSPHVHFRSPLASSQGNMSPSSTHRRDVSSDEQDFLRLSEGSKFSDFSRSTSIDLFGLYNHPHMSGQLG